MRGISIPSPGPGAAMAEPTVKINLANPTEVARETLRRLVPDIAHRDVFICGPTGFTTTVRGFGSFGEEPSTSVVCLPVVPTNAS